MATWNEALRGYIADVPRVVFKRCDGAKFYFDELFKYGWFLCQK